jgi:glycosyltransferase involved in cell wall biosynthesis
MSATPRSPLVSLIMPVWQTRQDWLRTAVNSALEQRGSRVELIVVDDGNPDPVTDLLSGIADPRLRIVRTDHAGPSAARNVGVHEAQGDRIRFVDSDDVLDLDSTNHLGSFMDGDDVIAYGGTLVCDEDLRPGRLIASTLQGHIANECLRGKFDVRLPALLFPRPVVDRAGPWDASFPVSEDWDFVLRALDHARVAGDRRVALYYRRHSRSVSRAASIAAGEKARRRLVAGYFERHPEHRAAERRRVWAATYMDCGVTYWDAGRYGKSIARLSQALLSAPASVSAPLARTMASRVYGLLRPR